MYSLSNPSTEITVLEINNRPRCACGNLCKTNGYNSKGRVKYQSICSPCAKSKHSEKKMKLKRLKGDSCSLCGFIPVHSCQLDVDHIDGNRDNNDKSNLMTLCANCHRLKTFINKDWASKKSEPRPISVEIDIQISLL